MGLHLALKLMAIPTVMGSMLTFGILMERASATDSSYGTPLEISPLTCELPATSGIQSSRIPLHRQGFTVASTGLGSGETQILDFSEAESDAAAILFGCDCPACINALRQLGSHPLLNNGTGHCLSSLQRRVTPQRMQEVLQNLEMRKMEQTR